MNANTAPGSCPQCGSPIPDNAPGGLCPKCVMGGAATDTEAGQPGGRGEAPSIDSVRAAFPQFEVLELIGQGGMGFVYKVRQPNLDRFAALKLLWPKLGADPAFAERFTREARVLARLNHPNIVAVYDFGRSGGFFYLLMEYVDGVNLRQAMRAGHFSPAEALALVPRICDALQFAHEEKVLHRDIKPENILLDGRGRLKIADFGIAKLVGEVPDKVTLTATGMAVGTPLYMAPEQLEHPQDVDQRADIYSLGVVFYEMLTGELPVGRFAPPSEKVTVDPRVDPVVLRALEREREKRFGTAGEVRTRVEDIRRTPPVAGPHGTIVTETTASAPGPGVGTPPPVAPGAQVWCRKAIVAAVMAGIGMVAPVVLTIVMAYWALGRGHSGPILEGGLVMVLAGGLLALAPGGAGSILGFVALREIRNAAGRLRGQLFAVWAALYWPLLVFNVLLVSSLVGAGAKIVAGAESVRGVALPFLAVTLLAVIAFDLWVTRRVWRWSCAPGSESRPRMPILAVLGELVLLGAPLLILGLVVWVPILLRSMSQ